MILANLIRLPQNIVVKRYTWNNVAITSADSGVYYTSGSNKYNVALTGYKPIAVQLRDFTGCADTVQFYIGLTSSSNSVGAISKTSQIATQLVFDVIYIPE